MEDFASKWNMTVVSHAQAMVKRFVEKSGGSEDSGSFAQKIVPTGLPLDLWGKKLTNFTHVKHCAQGTFSNILHFRLFYSFRTLWLFQVKMTTNLHLMKKYLITQFQMNPLFLSTI